MSDFVCLNPDRFINSRCQSKLGIIKEVHYITQALSMCAHTYIYAKHTCCFLSKTEAQTFTDGLIQIALLFSTPFLSFLSSLLPPLSLPFLFSQHSLASIFIIPSQHKTNCLKSKSRIPLYLFLYCLHLALYNTLGYFILFQTLRLPLYIRKIFISKLKSCRLFPLCLVFYFLSCTYVLLLTS